MRHCRSQPQAQPKADVLPWATMQFDLTDLRLLVHIHETGSITAGAQRSHLSLGAASERVRNLESRLGVELLQRGPRGVQPTPAGHTLLHHARQMVRQMQSLSEDMADHSAGLSGQVRLLCNTSALSEHLPPLLPTFLALHPRVSVVFEERSSQDIADAVRAGQADLGVVSDAVDCQGLTTLPFRTDPLALALPAGHALGQLRSMHLAQARNESFIGLSPGSALQALVSRHLARAPCYRVQLPHLDAVCRLVGLGAGVAVVPLAVARRHARSLHIRAVPLRDAWARRTLLLCLRSWEELPPLAWQLARHLSDPTLAGPAPH